MPKIALGYRGDKPGDIDLHRAVGHAEGFLALQTAPRFFHGQLRGVAERHFREVLAADLRRSCFGISRRFRSSFLGVVSGIPDTL